MDITTPYSVNDEVWFMNDNKLTKGLIVGVSAIVQLKEMYLGTSCKVTTDVKYWINSNSVSQENSTKTANQLFPTIEALIDDLQNKVEDSHKIYADITPHNQ